MGTEVSHALIMGSAPCGSWGFLGAYLEGAHYTVFCADGGIQHALSAGLKPDYLIGDWDSGGAPDSRVPCISLPVEKDMTDLQAAVDQAMDLGAEQLLLCGCTGGRLDHTASNLALLEYIADRGGHGLIADEDNEVRLLEGGTLALENRPAYRYLSLIPLDRHITGVTLRGVKYPLAGAVLTRGSTLSVSNEPAGAQMEITTGQGRLLLIRSERMDHPN